MAKREDKIEPEVYEAPNLGTIEGQKEAAKEVLDGESARDLLELAVGYIGPGGKEAFVGDPERWKTIRDKVEAFLLLNPK